jgi:hypothetical protein
LQLGLGRNWTWVTKRGNSNKIRKNQIVDIKRAQKINPPRELQRVAVAGRFSWISCSVWDSAEWIAADVVMVLIGATL